MLEKFGANVLNLFICFLFLYFYFSIGFSFTSLSFFTQCNEYYKSMYDHVIFSFSLRKQPFFFAPGPSGVSREGQSSHVRHQYGIFGGG